MSTTIAAKLWVETELDHVEAFGFCGGRGAFFSRPRPGRSGPNEDAALVVALGPDTGVLAVADGAGGQAGGAFASRTAVEHLQRALVSEGTTTTRERILSGIEAANDALLAQGSGAATTLVVLELGEGRVRPYVVGDSQVLLLGRAGTLRYLSAPHSPVGYAVRSGLIDESAAMQHLDRHLVSNVIGLEGMAVEVAAPLPLASGDTLLVASDGLFDNLSTEEIALQLGAGGPEEATAALAAASRDRMETPGGPAPSKPDDLTLLAFQAG